METMSPAFFFCINEIAEHPEAPPKLDQNGNWIPLTLPGYNYVTGAGVSGRYWFCNRRTIQPSLNWSPNGAPPYNVFSTFFSGGHGFWVLRGDATAPPQGEAWNQLCFDHNRQDYSSSLTNAGSHRTLYYHNPTAWWPGMLLPDIYHGSQHTCDKNYGGLTGELPILLSLIAFSMAPDHLAHELPRIMRNGDWSTHERPHKSGRLDKRGVVVKVYACEGNDAELRAYENGKYGKYYK